MKGDPPPPSADLAQWKREAGTLALTPAIEHSEVSGSPPPDASRVGLGRTRSQMTE